MEDIEIRVWSASDSYEDLTDLLHRAYARLAAMGFHFYASHQDVEATRSRCEAGETFVALRDSALVGTITMKTPGTTFGCPWYERKDVAVFGQFGVSPELQGSGIGTRLIERVEARALELGAAEIACDTAEGAERLLSYYRRLGFREVDKANWSVVNYSSIVLSKPLT